MIARVLFAIPLGTAVTMGLLFIMQLMIATGSEAVTDSRTFKVVDFVRVERDQVAALKERKPERPAEPELPPERPRPEAGGSFDTSLGITVSAPDLGLNANTGRLGFGVGDGEYLPIVKVSAVYPTRALARRLEGYVVVEFNVTPSGAVKDVVVVESTEPLFEKPAIEAALKFKYKPRVVDGVPVEVLGVRNKIVFAMEA
jgi:protein TonB